MAINGECLDRILSHVEISKRAQVREFARLSTEEQLVRLYVKTLETEEAAKANSVKAHLANAGYTTAAFSGLLIAELLDWRPLR